VTGHDYLLHRDVESPLIDEMLRPLDPRCRVVQFHSPLSDDDYRRLADWLAGYPSVLLRAYGSYYGAIRDLEFLRYFPTLRRFWADVLYNTLESIDGLGYLPADTHTLGLGRTKKRISLQPLARFTALRRLYLEGQTHDIEAISGLTALVILTLRSITLPDLGVLRPLKALRLLEIKLGGTRDLSGLEELNQLEYLELWMIRGFSDLAPLANTTSLEFLFLQALKQVTALPDLSRLTNLHRVWLQTMKGLTDLRPLLTAPALTQVAAVDMPNLQPADVAVLAHHPRLKVLLAELVNKQKNEEVERLVPVPRDGDWKQPTVLTD
jgi:internalin A